MGRRERERLVAERVAQDTGHSLSRMRESPDAELLGPNGERVGLEVVSVVDQEYLDSRRRIEETAQALGQLVVDSGIPILVTIGFDLQSFGVGSDNRSHQRWLKTFDLMKLLGGALTGRLEHEELLERGIERVAWLSWNMSEEPGASWGYSRRTNPGGTLIDICLAKKHEKLEKYRREAGHTFDCFWLAIDSLGPGTVEDGGFSMLLDRNFDTTYDKVLLLMRGQGGGFSAARDVTPIR